MAEASEGTLLGDEWDVVALRADGGIELLDTFLASDASIRNIDMSVFGDDFFRLENVRSELALSLEKRFKLNKECQECPFVSVCGGGIIHSRYSKQSDYSNTSIYCADMKHFIQHGIQRLSEM